LAEPKINVGLTSINGRMIKKNEHNLLKST